MEISFEANAIKELFEKNNIKYDENKNIDTLILELFLYIGKIKGLLYKNNCLFVNFETQKPIGVECENFANALCRIILLIWDDLYKSEKEEVKRILQNNN